MNGRVYEYEPLLYEAGNTGGAYVIFPYNIRKEFGQEKVKVHAAFDGNEEGTGGRKNKKIVKENNR